MLKKLIKHFDMFAAPPLLRVKGESESTNLFGGVCSILFIILFAYMFFAALVDLFLLRSITATETITVISTSYLSTRRETSTLSAILPLLLDFRIWISPH